MKLSMVTISFNQGRYLGECLDSVMAQKQTGDEYVVVDPGSTDNSRDLIRTRLGKGIDWAVLEPDHGPADGLNRGFARCSGDILGYINADDRLRPDALAFVRAYFSAHAHVDVLNGAICIIDARGRVRARRRTADAFDARRYAAGICTIGQQATFFRRAAFERAGGFNAANRICWDGELLVDMALAGARFARVPRVLGEFRIYDESITGSGRFNAQLWAEHARIAEKIARRGVRLYSPGRRLVERAFYKLNPARHLSYLLASE